MKLDEALQITSLKRATLAAGTGGLSREVRWVHIVDMPDVVSWVRPGQLLLTTGYAWPRDESDQRQLVRLLAEQNLAGVGLAVPRFFEHFPPAFCAEAERLALPLLEIPWEIPFAQITEELHGALLIEQAQVIEQSERIHHSLTRAALEASSLQDIADTLGKLINHAVTFEDQEGRILGAYTIPGTEDRVRRETLERGVTPPDVLDYLEQSGLLNAIDDAGSPQRIPPNPDLGFVGRIVCPIRLKGETVGRVWIIEGSAPLNELDLRAAEHASVVAALQIAQQRTIASVEARVGYSFLTTILEGRFEATPQSLERAQIHGLALAGSYRVGIFVMNEALPLSQEALLRRDYFAEQLRHHLLRLGFAPLISVSLNQIQCLLPDGADAHLLWSFLSRPDMAFGLSRAYTGVEGIRQAYLEMQGMLPHLRPNACLRYEDLLLPRVLMGAPDAQRAFVEEVFGPLKQHRSGDVLQRTLITFAEHGFHLNQTAKALHIHPKSLRYRITLVAELCELDFHAADTRFRVQLAAQLLRLRE